MSKIVTETLDNWNAAIEGGQVLMRQVLYMPAPAARDRRYTRRRLVILCQEVTTGCFSLASIEAERVMVRAISGEELYSLFPQARREVQESMKKEEDERRMQAARGMFAED